jgi:hypothetical protein
LGVTPEIGRVPTMEDPEGQVVVLSHRLWSEWFGRDPGVVGKTIEVAGDFKTIVGVLPSSFEFPDVNDIQ